MRVEKTVEEMDDMKVVESVERMVGTKAGWMVELKDQLLDRMMVVTKVGCLVYSTVENLVIGTVAM